MGLRETIAHASLSESGTDSRARVTGENLMSQVRIPLLVPDLPVHSEYESHLSEIDANRWYTNFGPLLSRFETGLQALFPEPSPALTTVSNGTLALELALASMGLTQGASVLIPAFTFVATASAVRRAGFSPVIADIDPATWLLTPAIARAAMPGARIDCVLPVAALGCPVDVDGWDDFCEQTSIPVLVDAAGAFGNQRIGRHTVVAFSLHATKALGIGEGGLVVSPDAALIGRVKRLSNFGIDVASGLAPDVGTNAKLSEFHAAVGLAALRHWPARQHLRRTVHRRYCEQLASLCPGIGFQARAVDGIYPILQVLLPQAANRAGIEKELAANGVETRRWYQPMVHESRPYAANALGDLPVAMEIGPRMLGLPFHLELSDTDINRVCTALAGALQRNAT